MTRAAGWEDLRGRLDAAAGAVSGSVAASAEAQRAVLEERARALARAVEAPDRRDTLEVVVFSLAGERYAVEATSVIAIFRVAELALLPGAEPPLQAVTPWRGEILPLLDLAAMTGAPAVRAGDAAWVLVLGGEHAAFGVRVDEVRELVSLDRSEIRPPAGGAAGGRNHLRGITRDAVLVLDGAALTRTYPGGSLP